MSEQVGASENAAVKETALPLAEKTTSLNVCGDVKPTTDTVAVPSPVKSKVPVVGVPSKVIVISAVNVSSVISDGVLLLLHAVISAAVIAVILNPESSSVMSLIETAKQSGADWYLTAVV